MSYTFHTYLTVARISEQSASCHPVWWSVDSNQMWHDAMERTKWKQAGVKTTTEWSKVIWKSKIGNRNQFPDPQLITEISIQLARTCVECILHGATINFLTLHVCLDLFLVFIYHYWQGCSYFQEDLSNNLRHAHNITMQDFNRDRLDPAWYWKYGCQQCFVESSRISIVHGFWDRSLDRGAKWWKAKSPKVLSYCYFVSLTHATVIISCTLICLQDVPEKPGHAYPDMATTPFLPGHC